LQPYVSIADALKPIERLGPRAFSKFHQPEKLTRLNKPVYDPNTKVVPCIQTKGLDISHPSGTRSFTPLELGQFQTLPLDFKFYGSQTQSIKQVGNMVPALPVKNLLLNCARVLEAFHHGLITAGEEIEDLDITLIEKGVEIPELESTPSHYFNLTSSAETAVSLYRYLTTPSLSDATAVEFSSAWATRKVEGRGKSGGMKRAFGRMSLENDSFDDDDETFGRRARRARRAPNDDTPIVIEDSD
jgi:DNA (cytosine-5)-methyltransferase 1